ncbi:MAG TPA: preprotein translocase subunit SecE [Candidatus Baltobacteraceae bacterium]|nr:preprotein translocase subunit SecE [Candidatus Baltobacteraceae bacterium]
MNRPTGGGGTTTRPGSPARPSTRPGSRRAASPTQVQDFFRSLVAEMRRVTWPSRQEWISATILTIGLVIVVGLYTYTVDEIFGFLFGFVHH